MSSKRELITSVLREECGMAFECMLTLVEKTVISPDTTLHNWEEFTRAKTKEINRVVEDALLIWIQLNSPLQDERLTPLIQAYQKAESV